MFFADFVNTLKGHFKKSISNEKLCGILFDAIIAPADVKNSSGEVLTIEKGEISRIMNQKISMPSALQDHVYDDAVIAGLSSYFKTHIVSKLAPQKSDLCHQLMTLIDEDKDIAPDSKVRFRLTANEDCIATFLAEVFIYVVRQDNKKRPTSGATVHQPILKLCGITESGESSSYVEVDRFHPRLEYNLVEYEQIIRRLYEEISQLKIIRADLDKPIKGFKPKLYPIIRHFEPIKINNRVRCELETCANKLNITLSNDFWEMWEITCEDITYKDEVSQQKYLKLTSLLKNIRAYKRLAPVDKIFTDILCVRLALRNDGSTLDEYINVRLIVDKNLLFTDTDLSATQLSTIQNVIDERDALFPNVTSIVNDAVTIEINFDRIMQHTTLVFPTVLLLKKYIPSIKYEIRSKFMPEVFSGSLTLQKK